MLKSDDDIFESTKTEIDEVSRFVKEKLDIDNSSNVAVIKMQAGSTADVRTSYAEYVAVDNNGAFNIGRTDDVNVVGSIVVFSEWNRQNQFVGGVTIVSNDRGVIDVTYKDAKQRLSSVHVENNADGSVHVSMTDAGGKVSEKLYAPEGVV